MPFYPAPPIVATVSGRKRCRYVSKGEQCTLPMYAHGGDAHRFRRDITAEHRADTHARMRAIIAEGGERGAFFADLLADALAREDGNA